MAAPPPRSWPALDVTARRAAAPPPVTPTSVTTSVPVPAPSPAASPPHQDDPAGASVDLETRLVLLLDDLAPVAIEEGDDRTQWRVYFADGPARDAAVAALQAALGDVVDVVAVEVEDEGWVYKVQEELRAVRVGRIVVAPPWDIPPPGPEDVLVVVEPSMGFGTGHHQSTRLCLEALQRIDVRGLRVVDVGTGSGVLALVAARLGASEVLALDHDEDSVAAARDNAARNDLARRVTIASAALETLATTPADVVFANLTAWILRRHAPALAALVSPAGLLVASGFTREQVPLVLDAFEGFSVASRLEEDDWVGLLLRRHA